MISKAIKVYGKVQNVGFRFYTKKKANELDLSGFVKNLTDGSVYIEVTGEENIVEQLINWCHSGSGLVYQIIKECENTNSNL